jgi:hypothetical protein
MSPRPSPCDGFTGQLPAYADRELGAAETTAVERHLEGCARCQGRLKEIESVGDVLKGWDAKSPAGGTAAARLHHAVLARIQEDGQRRRGEVRGLRLGRLALAASVLVAVGLPLALALRSKGRAAVEPGQPPYEVARGPAERPADVGGAGARITVPANELPGFQPWDRRVAAVETPALPPSQRDGLFQVGLEPQKQLRLEQHFRASLGVSGVWVMDPANGYRLLLTAEAARFFQQGERLELIRRENSEARSRTSGEPPQARSLRRTAGDLLDPVLRGEEGSSAWRQRTRPDFRFGRIGRDQMALTAWPLSRHEGAPAALHEVLDPWHAQGLGLLSFQPSGYDRETVLAIVEGNELPILLPAGQLLTGGETDRVVARSTWLPASLQQTVIKVPCAIVRSGEKRAEGGIRLTRYVAGPSLRALLAEGASPQAVLAHVRALRGLPMAGRTGLEWSLLDLFEGSSPSAEIVQFSAQAGAGFLAADSFGRLLGLEHVALKGEPGMLLVQRLLLGYTKEASWRRLGGNRVLALPGEAAHAALGRVRTATTPLLVPPVPLGQELPGVDRATFVEAELDAGLALEALRVEGRTAIVSLLPRPSAP